MISSIANYSLPTRSTLRGLRPIHVIGCGGTGSYLVPILVKLLSHHHVNITLWDGDRFEEGNLNRQLFDRKFIGENKAVAFQDLYKNQKAKGDIIANDRYFSFSDMTEEAYIFCCADNHPARKEVLNAVDAYGAMAIIGGNEYTDAEAYVFFQNWGGTNLDPRFYYPEIAESSANDPRSPESCVEKSVQTPQLALANMESATYMLKLFWIWCSEAHDLENEYISSLPIRINSNFSKITTLTRGS